MIKYLRRWLKSFEKPLTMEERKAQNWSCYFRGQIEV